MPGAGPGSSPRARLLAEEQIWNHHLLLLSQSASVSFIHGAVAPEPLGPTALLCPKAWGRGCPLPRASLGLPALMRVTALPSAEPSRHKQDQGQQNFSQGQWHWQQPPNKEKGPAAAGRGQTAARSPVPGSTGMGVSAAGCHQALDSSGPCEHRLCPDMFPGITPRAANIHSGTARQQEHRQLGQVSSARMARSCLQRVFGPWRGQTVQRASDKG